MSSLCGGRYILNLIDDFSKKLEIYKLKSKNHVFEKFKEWKKQVEIPTDLKVKKLKNDNGLEFVNEEFNKFCTDERNVRHKIVIYTP